MTTNSHKPKILVADDETVIADTLTTILQQCGFTARAVYSGEDALAQALSFAPDMFLSDVMMPGLDGIETAIRMRMQLPGLKVLLFSGQAATADLLDKARTQGYEFDVLVKPVHPKDLLAKIVANGVRPSQD
ncbi:MAG: response regulator [Terracidiphilus sp.]